MAYMMFCSLVAIHSLVLGASSIDESFLLWTYHSALLSGFDTFLSVIDWEQCSSLGYFFLTLVLLFLLVLSLSHTHIYIYI